MMSIQPAITATTDICDAYEHDLTGQQVRILTPGLLSSFGGKENFSGTVRTLKLFEDNGLVRQTLSEPGHGSVLVVDGGGSLRYALLGDQLAAMAADQGWAGIIIWGCIRDCQSIAKTDLGVFAIGTHPLRTVKRGIGQRDVPVTFGGVTFIPGDWICADADGVVVTSGILEK